MADIPEGVPWGVVVARFGAFASDGPDAGRVPDERLLSGTVTLTPSVEWVQFPGIAKAGRYHVDTLVCPVIDGLMYPPETTEPPEQDGVPAIATAQPNGVPQYVQWTATFNLDGVDTQPAPVLFNVPGDGGEVDLAAQVGAEELVPYVTVVSTEDRERAEAASADAMQWMMMSQTSANSASVARDEAVDARSGAETARDQAVAARDEAVPAATTATSARDTAVQARDAAEAAAAQTTAQIATKAGSPVGDTTLGQLPVGSLVVDSAATLGASLWQKVAAGSTAAAWRVVQGDTGWRDVTSLITTRTAGTAHLARRAGIILIRFTDFASSVTSGNPDLLLLPAGFRPKLANPAFYFGVSATVGQMIRSVIQSSGQLRFYGWTSGIALNGTATFDAQDDWPTTLPGTPA
ncbi:hypothetical protein [Microbacterium sp. KNMS]